jgi:8-oxo-dGTP pyrophosphatase MutT (NUDIX family)
MAAGGKALRGKPEVRAAGGLVWRDGVVAGHGNARRPVIEVVIIHRPSHADWSFPKGKLDKGESSEVAALREVEEETGLVCELGDEIAPARYIDGKGRLKEVRYWVMQPVGTRPWTPNDEVDRRLWVPVDDAPELLSYGHDRALLTSFVEAMSRR